MTLNAKTVRKKKRLMKWIHEMLPEAWINFFSGWLRGQIPNYERGISFADWKWLIYVGRWMASDVLTVIWKRRMNVPMGLYRALRCLVLSKAQRRKQIDNTYVIFTNQVFKQKVGIPIGTNCSPLWADLYLYSYKADVSKTLVREKILVYWRRIIN